MCKMVEQIVKRVVYDISVIQHLPLVVPPSLEVVVEGRGNTTKVTKANIRLVRKFVDTWYNWPVFG